MEQSSILMKFFLYHVYPQWRWKIWKVKFSSGIFISIFPLALGSVSVRLFYTKKEYFHSALIKYNCTTFLAVKKNVIILILFLSFIHSFIYPLIVELSNQLFLCRKFKLPLLFDEGCYILSCHFIVKHVSDTCYSSSALGARILKMSVKYALLLVFNPRKRLLC